MWHDPAVHKPYLTFLATVALAACGPVSVPSTTLAPTTTVTVASTPATTPPAATSSTVATTAPIRPDRPPQQPVPGRWEPTNPGGGGAFSAVAVDGELIVVATDLSGVVVSHDGGGHWRTIGAFAGLPDTHVATVAIDQNAPDVVYAGTDGGLYVSDDAGRTFAALAPRGFVSAVLARGSHIYAGVETDYDQADGTVLHSPDGGKTWEEIPLPRGRYVVKLDLDPVDPSRVLILTGDGRFVSGAAEVYLYEEATVTRLDVDDVVDAVFDRHHPATVWATSGGGDTSATLWMADGGPFRRVADHGGVIWAPADRPGTIRLFDPRHQFPWDDEGGTWESSDGGATWQRIGAPEAWDSGWSQVFWAFTDGFGGPVPSVGFDPGDGDRAVLVNSQFAYLSDDGGATFRPVFTDEVGAGRFRSRGLDNVVVADLAVGAGGTLYAGYWDLGCFRSVDGGGAWSNCNTVDHSGDWEGYGGFVGTVVADPSRPGVVWAAHAPDWEADAVLLRSDDAAASWVATDIPAGPDLLGLAVDPSSPIDRRTLAITSGGDVFVSTDDGRTWSRDFACGGCRVTAFGPGGTIYAGGEAGLWRRDPSGWVDVEGTFAGDVTGAPWTSGWRGVSGIAVGTDGTVWVSVLGDGGGVWRGDEHGFEAVRTGPYYRDVAVDPDHPQVVYAASSSAMEQGGYDPESRGLEVSVDGGDTWRVVDDGLAWPFVTTVATGADTVVIGSPGTGVAVGR